MPRRPRVFVEGAIYHVYCRTARREPVFADRREAERFVELIRDVKQRDRFALLAWCLMPNHYHLVLRTTEVPLWRSMRLIQGRFAQEFNRRHESLGSLWQERYKARIVENQSYFGNVLAYVHLNPVAAHLVATPTAWRWSGHQELMSTTDSPLVDVDQVWLLLGETAAQARKAYRNWIEVVRKTPMPEEPMDAVPWWTRRHSDCEDTVAPTQQPRIDTFDGTASLERPRLGALAYLSRAAAFDGMELERLASPRRDQATVQTREAAVLVGMERYGLRCRDLAMVLGRRADQVSRWAGHASRRRAHDVGFRSRLDTLDAAIANQSGKD